ncbi:MAG TPA: protein kinase, partial [Chlamydiales bacterium]|nr:protein kinase [Chlamydiales bacterium]
IEAVLEHIKNINTTVGKKAAFIALEDVDAAIQAAPVGKQKQLLRAIQDLPRVEKRAALIEDTLAFIEEDVRVHEKKGQFRILTEFSAQEKLQLIGRDCETLAQALSKKYPSVSLLTTEISQLLTEQESREEAINRRAVESAQCVTTQFATMNPDSLRRALLETVTTESAEKQLLGSMREMKLTTPEQNLHIDRTNEKARDFTDRNEKKRMRRELLEKCPIEHLMRAALANNLFGKVDAPTVLKTLSQMDMGVAAEKRQLPQEQQNSINQLKGPPPLSKEEKNKLVTDLCTTVPITLQLQAIDRINQEAEVQKVFREMEKNKDGLYAELQALDKGKITKPAFDEAWTSSTTRLRQLLLGNSAALQDPNGELDEEAMRAALEPFNSLMEKVQITAKNKDKYTEAVETLLDPVIAKYEKAKKAMQSDAMPAFFTCERLLDTLSGAILRLPESEIVKGRSQRIITRLSALVTQLKQVALPDLPPNTMISGYLEVAGFENPAHFTAAYLGEGAAGVVYKLTRHEKPIGWKNTADGDIVRKELTGDELKNYALKVLKQPIAWEDWQAKYPRGERVSAQIENPLILSITPEAIYGKDGSVIAIIMPFSKGNDLDTWIDYLTDATRLQRNPTFQEARPLIRTIASAFLALHKQHIAHLDGGAQNIQVFPDGSVKLLDYGFAQKIPPEGLPNAYTGSRYYNAPECVGAETLGVRGRVTTKADAFSLGQLMYIILEGRQHGRYEPLEKVQFTTLKDPELQHIIMQLLDPNPETRMSVEDCFQHPFFSQPPSTDELTVASALAGKVIARIQFAKETGKVFLETSKNKAQAVVAATRVQALLASADKKVQEALTECVKQVRIAAQQAEAATLQNF